jgi:hypothetical protein
MEERFLQKTGTSTPFFIFFEANLNYYLIKNILV